jgi:hypothetical protein
VARKAAELKLEMRWAWSTKRELNQLFNVSPVASTKNRAPEHATQSVAELGKFIRATGTKPKVVKMAEIALLTPINTLCN